MNATLTKDPIQNWVDEVKEIARIKEERETLKTERYKKLRKYLSE